MEKQKIRIIKKNNDFSLEYNVVIVSDCTSSVTEEIQRSNLRDMANVGAQIMTAQEFIDGSAELFDSVSYVHSSIMKV